MADAATLPLARSACAYPTPDTERLADSYDEEEIAIAYDDLRRVRRTNRIARVDKFDVFYKAYITAGVSALLLYTATGWIGDRAVAKSTINTLVDRGAAWIGLLVAISVAIGLRSGGRGGPLAFELAEVRHVLLSPADRFLSIRKPAIRHVLHAMFLGMCAGAAIGMIVGRRMPHHIITWVLCTSVFGVVVGALGSGVAMVASGLRIPRPLCDAFGALFFAWSAFDIWRHVTTSPATWLGSIPIWPESFSWRGALGIVCAVIATIAGVLYSNRCSIEAAERRSKLVGQLQFAATMQDLRTVMVLQRQLSQEQLRQRKSRRRDRSIDAAASPIVVRTPGESVPQYSTATSVRRAWYGYRHWSKFRMARLVALVALAALTLVGVWQGTSSLILATGILLWIAALDLVEPLAQEFDHPDRMETAPQKPGRVAGAHLVVPYFILFVLLTIAGLVLTRFLNATLTTTFLPLAIVAATCAVGGAAVVVVKQPGMNSGFVDTPETAGLRMAWRIGAPPAIAILGVLPIAIAQRSWSIHHNVDQMVRDMNLSYFAALTLTMLTYGYVRYGAEIREAAESNAKTQQERAEAAKAQADSRKAMKAQEAKATPKAGASSKSAQHNTRSKKGKKR